MKKTMIAMTMILLSFALLSCITINEVKSIALNWVPEEWYDRIDDNLTGGTPFAGNTITVTLDDNSTQTKDLSSSDITYTGSGVFVSGGEKYLERRYVGSFDVNIHYEGFTVSFEYFVDDETLTASLNGAADRSALKAVIKNFSFLTNMGLGSYFETITDHTVWEYSVQYTKDELDGGVFENAYQAQGIIKASFLHGLLSSYAASDYLDLLFESMDDETFEVIDWDVMGLNMLDLWYEGAMTHMAHPGAGFSQGQDFDPYPIEDLADIYDALFNGGAAVLLHPHYSPLCPLTEEGKELFGDTCYPDKTLNTKANWPGLLSPLIDDEDIALFLNTQFAVVPPYNYEVMGFAIIGFLRDNETYGQYFEEVDV
jgi:hypothetical protein